MKVELLRSIKGHSYFPGDLVEVEDEKARAWCEAGLAIPAKEELAPTENSSAKPDDESEEEDVYAHKIQTADSKKKTEKAVKK